MNHCVQLEFSKDGKLGSSKNMLSMYPKYYSVYPQWERLTANKSILLSFIQLTNIPWAQGIQLWAEMHFLISRGWHSNRTTYIDPGIVLMLMYLKIIFILRWMGSSFKWFWISSGSFDHWAELLPWDWVPTCSLSHNSIKMYRYSFIRYLLSASYVPHTVLCNIDTAVNKTKFLS